MKNRLLIVLLLICGFLAHSVSYACSPSRRPTPSVTFTDDMKHVLVMLRGGPGGLSNKYRSSGLYRMDGSRDPVWELDWFSTSVLPHSGGRYLVQLGDSVNMVRATGDRSERRHLVRGKLYPAYRRNRADKAPDAVSFYDNGKLLHTYQVDDLFDDISNVVPQICSDYKWFSDYVLDENANTFILTTTESITYTFSIVTGKLIKAEKHAKPEYRAINAKAHRNKMSKRSEGLSEQATTEILDIIQAQWINVQQLGQPYLSDYSLAKKIIGIHGRTFHYFDKSLHNKKDLSRLAVSRGEAAGISTVGRYKNDARIARSAVEHDGTNYSSLSDNLKDNKNLLESALPLAGMSAYNSAPERLRNDRKILIEALRAQLVLTRYAPDSKFYINNLGSIPERYLKDERVKQLIDAVLELHSARYLPAMAEIHKEEAYSLIRRRSAER